MSQQRHPFLRFRDAIATHGAGAISRRLTLLAAVGVDEVFYIPFEHVNRQARLVLIGITPGPNQLEIAYRAAQRLIREDRAEDEILRETKRECGFGGPLRPNLVRMMRHFGIANILGIPDENDLWGTHNHLFHATSVIPHAAFRNGKPFAGSFADVLSSKPFGESFRADFLPILPEINRNALFIGLGPTPQAALKWCVGTGILRTDQVLGSLAHPSGSGGSQVSYFLREKTLADLKPKDPVRSRAAWLDKAYAEMHANTTRLAAKHARQFNAVARA